MTTPGNRLTFMFMVGASSFGEAKSSRK
jgi:hypothetical protein